MKNHHYSILKLIDSNLERSTEIEWNKPAFQFYGFTSWKICCKLFNSTKSQCSHLCNGLNKNIGFWYSVTWSVCIRDYTPIPATLLIHEVRENIFVPVFRDPEALADWTGLGHRLSSKLSSGTGDAMCWLAEPNFCVTPEIPGPLVVGKKVPQSKITGMWLQEPKVWVG